MGLISVRESVCSQGALASAIATRTGGGYCLLLRSRPAGSDRVTGILPFGDRLVFHAFLPVAALLALARSTTIDRVGGNPRRPFRGADRSLPPRPARDHPLHLRKKAVADRYPLVPHTFV